MPRRNPSPSPVVPPGGGHPRTPGTLGKSPEITGGPDVIRAAATGLAPGLYVTATPIGNARDITLRALSVLSECDAIVAEDTRVTAKLLAIHGISRTMLSYGDHNAREMRPKLLARLKDGARLALVSDAGTPLVSDPGMKLVAAARGAGVAVYPVPGASAVLAALMGAGLPTDRFLFAGFLSAKAGERRTELDEVKAVPASLIFYESPNRLADALADMAAVLGDRAAVVARELTKLHEEFRSDSLDALAAHYAGTDTPKGEVTIVVAPPADVVPDSAKIESLLRQALPFMPVKAASALIGEATGASRHDIYQTALRLKDDAAH